MREVAGAGLTITVTELLPLQPLADELSVSMYVVVTIGDTRGLASEDVNPTGRDVQL